MEVIFPQAKWEILTFTIYFQVRKDCIVHLNHFLKMFICVGFSLPQWATSRSVSGDQNSFFLPFGFYLFNSGHQGWQQVPLFGEPSCWLSNLKKKWLFYVFMYACSRCTCTLRARRSQIREVEPLDWSYRQVMSHHVGAGNQTLVLRKISKCS